MAMDPSLEHGQNRLELKNGTQVISPYINKCIALGKAKRGVVDTEQRILNK
jgi:hypothetical protein